MRFDGETYDPLLDHDRLETLLNRVRAELAKGAWLTLGELSRRVRGNTASVGARLRDLRKPRFGGHVIERRRSGSAWEYRLVTEEPNGQLELLK